MRIEKKTPSFRNSLEKNLTKKLKNLIQALGLYLKHAQGRTLNCIPGAPLSEEQCLSTSPYQGYGEVAGSRATDFQV